MKVIHDQDDDGNVDAMSVPDLLSASIAINFELARQLGLEGDEGEDGQLDYLVGIIDAMIADKKRPSRQRGLDRYAQLEHEAYINALLDIRLRLTKQD